MFRRKDQVLETVADNKPTMYCSFCGKSQHEIRRLIGGHQVFICDECVDLCNDILVEAGGEHPFPPMLRDRHLLRKRAFCACPFCEPHDTIYRVHIRPLLTNKGWEVLRADDVYRPGTVMQQVWKGISECGLMIADLTGRNANVMYEVGIAHTLGKPVIVIAQDPDDIPFDLRQHRYLLYKDTPDGHENVALKIAVALDPVPREAT